MADGVSLKVAKKGRLLAKLKRTVPEIETVLEKVNGKSAGDMVAYARTFVPVRTGALRDSLRAIAPGNLPARYSQGAGKTTSKAVAWLVTVGNSKVRYAHLVEFGTAGPYTVGGLYAGARHPGIRAQPYFFPAYRLIRKRHRGRVTRAINRELKKKGIRR